MSIVNCKVKYIRPEFKNLKEWMSHPSNVYIGRAGVVFIVNEETNKKERFPKSASNFQNPYKVGKDGTREEVIEKYEIYIREKLQNRIWKKQLLNLEGKNLGCWCHPEPCHGDILLKLIQEYKRTL